MMERRICCCTSGKGTMTIAIIGIVLTFLLMIEFSFQVNKDLTDNTNAGFEVAQLVVTLVDLIFYVILLTGYLRRMPGMLKVWCVWTVIVIILQVVKFFAVIPMVSQNLPEIVQLFLSICFHTFCFYVVRVHIADITETEFVNEPVM